MRFGTAVSCLKHSRFLCEKGLQIVKEVRIDLRKISLGGTLTVPAEAQGIVIFAHGSGSSRHSPRNRYVADVLNKGALATLLFDLLTGDEEAVDIRTARLRFDIPFLAQRLLEVLDWLKQQKEAARLRFGLFGSSTGGGAALVAAAQAPDQISAVVSRGGRPDLAAEYLPEVKAPTLLIVGGDDVPVIAMNRAAMEQMRAPVELKIVPGATHLFEEPGKLEEVARLARDFFQQHLQPAS
jgi:putative phosphoribosyl transferase